MHDRATAGGRGPRPAHRWSLLRSTVVLAVVALLLAGVAAVLLISTANSLGDAQRHQNGTLDPAQNAVQTLLGDYLDQETGLRADELTGQPAFLQPYQQAAMEIPRTEAALRRLLDHDRAAGPALEQMISAYQTWSSTFAGPQLQRVSTGQLAAAQAVEASGRGKALFDTIRVHQDRLSAVLRTERAASEARVSSLQGRLETLLIVVLCLIVVGILGTLYITLTRVVRPLGALAGAAREVAGGRLHAEVPAAGPQELQALATDLTAMRYRLLEEINRARLAGEALRLDGPTVAALHEALVPRVDEHPDLEVVGRLDPAEGVLAGDWFDLIRVGDALAVVVGDVSGHGPRSAVLALTLRSTIATRLLGGGTPGEALSVAAATVAGTTAERFATVFVALIEPSAGVLRYANAGHPSALLARGGDHVELAPTGPFVSPIVATWSWSTQVEPFRPGDRLLVYTDGVTEGRNATKEEYGLERLKASLSAAGPDLARFTLHEIAEQVDRFVGASQSDDRTLVYVGYAGHGRPAG